MTTFQDPPPHSRRAARANERGETPATAPEAAQQAAPAESAPYSFDSATPAQQSSAPAAPASGRRAEHRGPAEAESADQAPYRVRDYSPEGRRSAGASAPGSDAAPARPVELDYQTQGVPPGGSHAAPPAPPLEDTMNHTLSRRELREMRAAAEAQAPALQLPPDAIPEPIDSLLNSGPIAIPTLAPPPGQSQALAEAMAEFDMLTRSRREAEARARDAQVASLATPIIPQQANPLPQSAPAPPVQPQPVAQQPVAQQPVVQQPEAQQPVAQGYAQPSGPEGYAQPSAPVPQAAPAPVQPVASTPSAPQAPALAAPVFSDPPSAVLPPAQPTAVPSAPTDTGRSPRAAGHWRVQAEAEDDELPYENTISRTVGANPSAITTSALVLPSVPQPDSLLNAITSTGEILVTGTIDLPRSLGSTGAHPNRIDNSDFEDDPLDSQVSAPDSAPIRAIRAVSTNTSTRGVIETKKPTGTRLLTVVIVVASVLCVSLVGLLVYAFATNKL